MLKRHAQTDNRKRKVNKNGIQNFGTRSRNLQQSASQKPDDKDPQSPDCELQNRRER